jgi:hypothetical protein
MEKTYRKAVDGFDEGLDVEVVEVSGGGIGEKGHVLKRILGGDDSVLEVAT